MHDAHTPRPGDRVTLRYRIRAAGRDIVDAFGDPPETFALGHGEIAAPLESLLFQLRPGEHRHFSLAPEQAFGLPDPALLQTLPRAEFPAATALHIGDGVDFPLPNGSVLTGYIQAVAGDQVTVDFNHPLAGLAIEFEVELLAVADGRAAR